MNERDQLRRAEVIGPIFGLRAVVLVGPDPVQDFEWVLHMRETDVDVLHAIADKHNKGEINLDV